VEPVPLPVDATVEDANEEPLPSLARSEVADMPAQGESSGSSGANQLSVTRLPGGGLRIEAPEALAEPLAALLESLARSLRQAVPPPAHNAATNGAADAASEHDEPTHADVV
jgi:hypothetical protein